MGMMVQKRAKTGGEIKLREKPGSSRSTNKPLPLTSTYHPFSCVPMPSPLSSCLLLCPHSFSCVPMPSSVSPLLPRPHAFSNVPIPTPMSPCLLLCPHAFSCTVFLFAWAPVLFYFSAGELLLPASLKDQLLGQSLSAPSYKLR